MTSNHLSKDPAEIAIRLIHQRNLGTVNAIKSISGGRNNRTFRVEGSGGPWLLKQYFSDPSGSLDRRAAEWNWSTFCWQNGVSSIPEPLATEASQQASLFEFVDGRHLLPDEVTQQHVEQCAHFIARVNRHRELPAAAQLVNAAEACFSFEEHIQCVGRRIDRLVTLPISDSLDRELQNWMQQSLIPSWQSIESRIRSTVTIDEIRAILPMSDRCLSPSDFGFHNALLDPEGRLRFLDFEYSGWDDPAKLVCDFFWQPQCPAPCQCRPTLIAALAGREPSFDLKRRLELLFPVYGIKWCCLVLNEFVAADRHRREFASRPIDDGRRKEQFACARRLLVDTCSLTK